MTDQHSDKIIDFQIVHVSEVSSSNAMEREGFKRSMEHIHNSGADVQVVANIHIPYKTADTMWTK